MQYFYVCKKKRLTKRIDYYNYIFFYFTFIVTLNCQAAWTFFKIALFVLHGTSNSAHIGTTWEWENYDRIFIFGWSLIKINNIYHKEKH